MNILIVGAGKVGFQLAKYFSKTGGDIVVIDESDELIRRINDQLDVQGMVGNATEPDVLKAASIEDCDMLIAVTRSDETNIVVCQIAYTLFGVDIRIARLRSSSYTKKDEYNMFTPDHIPITTVISPEREVAYSIVDQLRYSGTTEILTINSENISKSNQSKSYLIGLVCKENCPLINTPLRQLTLLFPDLETIVCAVIRNNQIFIPSSNDELLTDDLVYISCSEASLDRSLKAFGKESKKYQKLTIVGGGTIGFLVALEALKLDTIRRIRIIENNPEVASYIAEKLPQVTVIQGSGTDLDFIESLKITDHETVVAVTNFDEINVFVAAVFKKLGAGTSIALVTNDKISSYIESFNIDVVVNPRMITISTILKHVRHGRIRKAQTIRDNHAELIEGEILESSVLAGKLIQNLDLPDGVLIVGILRLGEFIIPKPSTLLVSNDIITFITLPKYVEAVEKLLSLRPDIF